VGYTKHVVLQQLRVSERAIRVDRLRENDFVVVVPFGSREHVGDGRERRVIRRCRVQFHFVADQKRSVQYAPERVHPTQMLRTVLGRRLISVDRNFEVFFNVVVARRPVLHFLFDELVQRTVTGRSAHRNAPTKATPEQRFSDDRDECDGQENERERHRKRVGQLNAQSGRVPA